MIVAVYLALVLLFCVLAVLFLSSTGKYEPFHHVEIWPDHHAYTGNDVYAFDLQERRLRKIDVSAPFTDWNGSARMNGIQSYKPDEDYGFGETNWESIPSTEGIEVVEGVLTDDKPTDPYNTAQFRREDYTKPYRSLRENYWK